MSDDILLFFSQHMEALPLYEKLEERILTEIPDVKVKAARTQISFSSKRGFAFVSFNPLPPGQGTARRVDDGQLRAGLSEGGGAGGCGNGALSRPLDPSCDGGKYVGN